MIAIILILLATLFLQFFQATNYTITTITITQPITITDTVSGEMKDVSAEIYYNKFIIETFLFAVWGILTAILWYIEKPFNTLKKRTILILWFIVSLILLVYIIDLQNQIFTRF